ncbi:unnamed protein product [Rotaria sp. Silwood2]|nr:unnamed protein product [Rotaria sp. Silwood2]CAF3032700.1 unnamed protein product [Rotaria sp. Silwood2]CAF3246874.1 unnamed protein product [Rotaria sp. Silwood2]CAF4301178.1 unnamed protein product [Rotaria sp. Silwood2]CAF4510507.1 unnamed protein product [Rotaria sp. Silwood2]
MAVLRVVSNLTHLKVDAYYINCDGYRWERIIDDYLAKLKVFRLRMHIQFPGKKNNEQHVDQLVDSFRTQFWLEKHQWFIHCRHKSEKDYMSIILYSLPYAFDDFVLSTLNMAYKSTCPQNNDYYSYTEVNNLRYEHFLASNYISFTQFFNIRNISIDLRLDQTLWRNAQIFYQLMSITIFSTDAAAQFHLQSLLDRSPSLNSLIISS